MLNQRQLVERLREAFRHLNDPRIRLENSSLYFRELGIVLYLANTHYVTSKHVQHNLGAGNRERLQRIMEGKLPEGKHEDESAYTLQDSSG